MPEIRNIDQYLNSKWPWEKYDDCFTGVNNYGISDMDGWLERNGLFMAIETKSPGAKIPLGQRIAFQRLVKTGYWVVMVIWGTPGNPEKIFLKTPTDHKMYKNANNELLRKLLIDWWNFANKWGKPDNGTV